MSLEEFRIGHLDHLSSPWGNAGGVVRTFEEVSTMATSGVGWIEAGSYTLEPRYGNQKDVNDDLILLPGPDAPLEVYNHNKVTGLTANSLGMPNVGMDEVEKQIPEMNKLARTWSKDARLIINVAPVSDSPVTETLELVRRAYEAGADAVLVNLGCPNVLDESGERHQILCYSPEIMFAVLAALRGLDPKYPKVFVRTSPFPNYEEALKAYRNIWAAKTVSAVWTPNTWPIQKREVSPLDVGGGGWSGPAMAEKALHQVNIARKALAGSGIDVVLSSGVANYKERRAAWTIKQALDLGAVAAAGTTFYYESTNGWHIDTYNLLEELAD